MSKTTVRGTEARVLRLQAWKVMRGRQYFTSADLASETGMSLRSAQTLLRKLSRAGVVACVEARKPGPEGLCDVFELRAEPHRVPVEVDPAYYWQQQAWQAARIKRRFTASEVLRCMGDGLISRRRLSAWLKALVRAGYLHRVGRVVPGQETVFSLAVDAGPEPPVLPASKAGQESAPVTPVDGAEAVANVFR